jgi:hypothetical protein
MGTKVQVGSKVGALAVAMLAILGPIAGCSSDGSSSGSTTSEATSSSNGSANPVYATWCASVQNLLDQSSPGDLSDLGALASFSQAITSLASTAPEPIQEPMQTLATATMAKLTAVQQDPSATLPAAVSDEAKAANDEVATFVADNCGLTLPSFDL